MNESWLNRVLLAGTLMLLGFLLYPTLGLMPFFAIGFLLWFPVRHGPDGRAIFAVILLLLVGWILHQVRWVVYPLLAAMLLAYWLDPVVDRLQRLKLPRSVGALLALLPIAAFLGLATLVLVPTLINQLEEIATKIPDALTEIQQQVEPLRSRLEVLTRGGASSGWVQQALDHMGTLLRATFSGMSGLGKGVGKVIQLAGMLALVPVLAFYLLVDWDRVRDGLVGLIPPRFRGAAQKVNDDIQDVLPRYLRGQFLIAGIQIVLFTVGFFVAGLPEAAALGFLAGAFSLLPVIGLWMTVLVVGLSALIQPDPMNTIWKVALVFVVMQTLEGQVLVPRIQGKGLGLHPFAVLLAVLSGGLLFGLPGVLLSVPALGVAQASLPRMVEIYRGSRLYEGDA